MFRIKPLIIKSVVLTKNVIFNLFKISPKHYVIEGIPYYSQWETPGLILDILAGKQSPLNDPAWKKSGAKTSNDYLNWSWNGCGLACLQMILAKKIKRKIPLVELGEKSLIYKCYLKNEAAYKEGDYANSLPGLFYKPFVDFAASEYGLKVIIHKILTVGDIINAIKKGNSVIASVGNKRQKYKNAGHLVLVVGYDINKRILYVQDPSAFFSATFNIQEVAINTFIEKFQYRGLEVFM